jgi:hypothetical protein
VVVFDPYGPEDSVEVDSTATMVPDTYAALLVKLRDRVESFVSSYLDAMAEDET